MDFKLVSDYAPMGDQPEAIAQLVAAIGHGSKHNVLQGVTGSGKTSHDGQRHRRPEPSDTGFEPQQDPRGAALRRVQELLSPERRRVLRLLLRLLPARGLPPLDGHLHREGPFDQRRDREDAAQHRGDAPLGTARRDRRVERLVSLRLRQSGGFPRHGHHREGGSDRQLQALPLQTRRGALHAHGTRSGAGDVPRERRHGGHHGRLRRVRQPVFPRRLLRQRGRGHLVDRSRHGTAHPDARHADALPDEPLRHHEGAHPRRRAADLPRSGPADRVLRARGTHGGGAADQAAGRIRPRDDQGAGLLLGHRELLALLRRPCRGDAPLLPDRLLPEGLHARRGREPRDPAAGPCHVRRRPGPQGEPRRIRLPPPRGEGQPAGDLLRI